VQRLDAKLTEWSKAKPAQREKVAADLRAAYSRG
jgi:hypothetical protein